ncbi:MULTISPECIES: cold-shock protein [Pedobacter]|uniref:Cold-shock protein n=1 Tax=Pedobacter miscanthi TaxID=2259170 RepID=A0A366LE09_9SPHI|nr:MULTISPECIES: cold shock domain-containing protein [Pedobacter]RBQ07819.1 cold-shock protein [Pedobacter miscanthi]RBQ11739.1 cold-shock protein [Pedobacter miscanthi]
MASGKVKFFNESKGFGFVVEEGTGKEFFVHISGLKDDVRENDEVTFDVQDGKKGPNAVNVKLV